MLTAPVVCPVCGESVAALPWRFAGTTTVACGKVTPPGAVRVLANVVVIGAGPGVDQPVPRELTMAEKQAEVLKKQQELAMIEAQERIKASAQQLDADLAAARGKKNG